jgi:TetR/AcrR family transcriptional repressor of nem operon
MAQPESKRRSDTAARILDQAEQLIQTRGYSAISYADIATALDIRKASIHYHFPTKADLGVAVIERYDSAFRALLEGETSGDSVSAMKALDRYLAPMIALSKSSGRICLCGALAGEFLALPVEMQTRITSFFRFHQDHLAGIMERGVTRGEFVLSMSPRELAQASFSALQGALLLMRATGGTTQLTAVVTAIKSQLHVSPSR